MPDLSTLVLFAVACLALTATPGPDMLLIASRSASQGRAAGFASLAGIQVGLMVNGLVIFTASRIGRVFAQRNRFSRVPQLLLGSVFAGLAIRLALAARR
jgi:threonine/homoserine/homoserine lactone efflux protein